MIVPDQLRGMPLDDQGDSPEILVLVKREVLAFVIKALSVLLLSRLTTDKW